MMTSASTVEHYWGFLLESKEIAHKDHTLNYNLSSYYDTVRYYVSLQHSCGYFEYMEIRIIKYVTNLRLTAKLSVPI
jgi:hypothetical protein